MYHFIISIYDLMRVDLAFNHMAYDIVCIHLGGPREA